MKRYEARADAKPVSASLAVSTLATGSDTVTAGSVAVDMEGVPTQGEIWTLTVDGTAYQFVVLYGNTLSDIAAGLGRQLPISYNVSVSGRVLTISKAGTSGMPPASNVPRERQNSDIAKRWSTSSRAGSSTI